MTDRRARLMSCCVLVACALVIAVTATALGWRLQGNVAVSGYDVGGQIDVPSDWLAEDRPTLLVFLRSDCAASRQFLAELAGRSDLGGFNTTTRLVLPVTETKAESDIQLAGAAGFEMPAIRTVDFSALRLKVVPSLVLVGRDGRVVQESGGLPAAVAMLHDLDTASGF